ncbi:B3 domain-containing transcription factor VRN1 [Glycine soja]
MIPNKFTKIYGGNLSNPVFLKAPDGIKWKVYWTKDDGGRIWLNKGWKEFATHYSLRYGHMVINDTFEVLDEVAPSQNSKPKSTISTPQPHKKLRRCSTTLQDILV